MWKCPIPGTCLGGANSRCLEGFTGPLCETCAPSYYGNPKKEGCTACPAGVVELGVRNRAYWSLITMALAFGVLRVRVRARARARARVRARARARVS